MNATITVTETDATLVVGKLTATETFEGQTKQEAIAYLFHIAQRNGANHVEKITG